MDFGRCLSLMKKWGSSRRWTGPGCGCPGNQASALSLPTLPCWPDRTPTAQVSFSARVLILQGYWASMKKWQFYLCPYHTLRNQQWKITQTRCEPGLTRVKEATQQWWRLRYYSREFCRDSRTNIRGREVRAAIIRVCFRTAVRLPLKTLWDSTSRMLWRSRKFKIQAAAMSRS